MSLCYELLSFAVKIFYCVVEQVVTQKIIEKLKRGRSPSLTLQRVNRYGKRWMFSFSLLQNIYIYIYNLKHSRFLPVADTRERRVIGVTLLPASCQPINCRHFKSQKSTKNGHHRFIRLTTLLRNNSVTWIILVADEQLAV